MGLEVKMNFEGDGLFRRLQSNFGDQTRVGRMLLDAVSRQTLYFIGSIQRNQMSGRRGGLYLNVDTGNLRRSWFPETKVVGGDIITKAYTNVKYAAIHEYGGVIHRKARVAVLSFSKRGRFTSPSAKAFQSKAQGQRQQKTDIGAHAIRIPKRLMINEQWNREMPGRYEKAVLDVIRKVVSGG